MSETNKSGTVKWKSPSNIALVKYWGKYGRQFPQNPSISLTLTHAHTITSVDYSYSEHTQPDIKLDFRFNNEPNSLFKSKIRNYLRSISDIYPLVYHLDLDINTENSFPHSTGIASSASAMSALALCLCDIERNIHNEDKLDMKKVSMLARLGSGSACRSVYGPVAVWGESDFVNNGSNKYAIPYSKDIDPVFNTYHDDILIVSSQSKSVSSRAGHAMMENNIYAHSRFEQAHKHLADILKAMKQGDIHAFGAILEKEALTLHALMMASDPPYILMEPSTITIIKKIMDYRKQSGHPVYFTLDAGPNIHLLYPDNLAEEVARLEEELIDYCENGSIIRDRVGKGPEKLL